MEEIVINDIKGSRALIAAILVQAFNDAIVVSPKKSVAHRDKRSAISFIDHNNEMFICYCDLLDLEPEYMVRKMQEKIRNHTFKPLKEFRN